MKNICEGFTHKMATKASWHRNYVTVILCIFVRQTLTCIGAAAKEPQCCRAMYRAAMRCFGPIDQPNLQPVTLNVLPALPIVTVLSHIPGSVATTHCKPVAAVTAAKDRIAADPLRITLIISTVGKSGHAEVCPWKLPLVTGDPAYGFPFILPHETRQYILINRVAALLCKKFHTFHSRLSTV